MKSSQIIFVNKVFLGHFDMDQQRAKPDPTFFRDNKLSFPWFIEKLKSAGRGIGLIYLNHQLNADQLSELLDNQTPVLIFAKSDKETVPLILRKDRQSITACYADGEEKISDENDISELITNKNQFSAGKSKKLPDFKGRRSGKV